MIKRKDFWVLVLFSFFCSIFFTILGKGPCLQAYLDAAQIYADVVKYPDGAIEKTIQLGAWSLPAQILAFFLKNGASEEALSSVVMVISGCVVFLGVSLIAYAILKRLSLSIFFTSIWFASEIYDYRLSYPMILFGSSHSGGRFGIAISLLSLGLIGVELFWPAIALLILGLSIHLVISSYMLVCVLASVLFLRLRGFKLPAAGKSELGLLALSLAASGTSFLMAKVRLNEASFVWTNEILQLFNNYIRYWDHHRQPAQVFEQSGMILCVLSVLLIFLNAKKNHLFQPSKGSVLFLTFFISLVASVLLGVMAYFPTEIPILFLRVMPGRFVNIQLAVLFLFAVGFSIRELGSDYIKPIARTSIVFILIYIQIYYGVRTIFFTEKLGLHFENERAVIYGLFLLLLLAPYKRKWKITALIYCSSSTFIFFVAYLALGFFLKTKFQVLVHSKEFWVLLFLILLGMRFSLQRWKQFSNIELRPHWTNFASLSVLCLVFLNQHDLSPYSERMKTFRNVEIFRKIHDRSGMVLIAGGLNQFQIVTRRPVLLGATIDGIPYTPSIILHVESILKEIYGYSFNIPPNKEDQHQGSIPNSHRKLWEARTSDEWKNLAARFNFEDIVVPRDWNLNLTLIADGSGLRAYSAQR